MQLKLCKIKQSFNLNTVTFDQPENNFNISNSFLTINNKLLFEAKIIKKNFAKITKFEYT